MNPDIIATIFLFIFLVIFYAMLTEHKTRKLEERMNRQKRPRERTCGKCDNFMIEVHNDGEGEDKWNYHCTSRFACFIDRKEVKPFQPACKQYEKRVN